MLLAQALEPWVEIATRIGVPGAVLLAVGWWFMKFLIPHYQNEIATTRRENEEASRLRDAAAEAAARAREAAFVSALDKVEQRHAELADAQERRHVEEQKEHADAVRVLASEVKAQGDASRRLIEKLANLDTGAFRKPNQTPARERRPSDQGRASQGDVT